MKGTAIHHLNPWWIILAYAMNRNARLKTHWGNMRRNILYIHLIIPESVRPGKHRGTSKCSQSLFLWHSTSWCTSLDWFYWRGLHTSFSWCFFYIKSEEEYIIYQWHNMYSDLFFVCNDDSKACFSKLLNSRITLWYVESYFQLKIGNRDYNLHKLIKTDNRRLEICCLVWWVLISAVTFRW